jgi:hypothetical protein
MSLEALEAMTRKAQEMQRMQLAAVFIGALIQGGRDSFDIDGQARTALAQADALLEASARIPSPLRPAEIADADLARLDQVLNVCGSLAVMESGFPVNPLQRATITLERMHGIIQAVAVRVCDNGMVDKPADLLRWAREYGYSP